MNDKKIYKLCIIGAGNMGQAIISGLITRKIFNRNQIAAIEISQKKIREVKKKFKIECSDDFSICRKARIILLAVKPQDLDTAMENMAGFIKKSQFFISIIAGKSIKTIEKTLPFKASIARVMPNTPAFVMAGISGICFNRHTTPFQKKEAIKILRSCLLYTSPSPRDLSTSRMPSSA